jgi:ParB-like chromosome segregation protein Spo0J
MTKTAPKMEVHPLADLFPMMTDDELAGLAADIKANGLIHPIILDPAGKVVIDGRNRLRACEIAGVEPNFERTDKDPAAFIVSVNLARRNLSKGQQAMALALIYPDGDKAGRGKKGTARNLAETVGFSATRIRECRLILRNARPLAEAVLAGTMKLDAALRKVEEDRDAASSADAKYSRLRAAAPDFADLVDDESMSVDEALAAMQQREKDNRVHRETGINAASAFGSALSGNASSIARAIEVGTGIIISGQQIELMRSAATRIEEVYGRQNNA